jgi:predicted RNA-binding protein with PIN domain
LKRFLKFQKLPGSALAVVRRAIEDDQEFRVRAASVASVELAGEIGWRWLVREDGWEAEVANLAARAAEDQDSEAIGRGDRTATRQRDAAERAAVKARAELAVTKEELAREHERRTASERTSADAARRAEELDRQLADHRLELRKARDQADAARGSVQDLRHQLDVAERRVVELGERLEREIVARVGAEERAAGAAVRPADGQDPDRFVVDRAAVAGALASLTDAAGGLRELAGALDATAKAFGAGPPPASERSQFGGRDATRSRSTDRRRRTPLGIPGGLLDDSAEVALHLVKQPEVTLIVDGYNVAKLGWPTADLPEQRDRLLDGLEDLVRRIGVRAVVVFDGADVSCPPTGRRLLRVRFTPAGVLADDEIRELTASLPPEQPVVVATNDQEVVRGVRSSGANVITSEQLLAIARR